MPFSGYCPGFCRRVTGLTFERGAELHVDIVFRQVVAVFKVLSRNLQAVTGQTFDRGAKLHVDIVLSNRQPQMFNTFLDFYGTRKISTVSTTAYEVRRRV